MNTSSVYRIALRGHLHTAFCTLWIDPLVVTPCTLRLELEKGLLGSDEGDYLRCAILSPSLTRGFLLWR
jgi:hypothetical protein